MNEKDLLKPYKKRTRKTTEKQLNALKICHDGMHGFFASEEKYRAAMKKSGETRHKQAVARKQMKEQYQALLSCRLSKNSSVRKKLKQMGIVDEEINNQMAVLYNIFLEASKASGASAVSAAAFIRDTIGEKPKDTQVNVQTDFESYIQSLESDEEF